MKGYVLVTLLSLVVTIVVASIVGSAIQNLWSSLPSVP